MSLNRPIAACLVALATVWSLAANAQVYRIVGPDGRVTFSDKPPPADAKASTAPAVPIAGGGAAASSAALPFELRNTVNRYPVTLYSRQGCAPCDQSREFLAARGIPFTEKTVTTNDDVEALQRIGNTDSLPFATIGSQQLKGFSEAEWGQYLDAAGYPKTSQLPASYRRPPATPLVAVQSVPQAGGTQQQSPQQQQRADRPAPTVRNPTNPAGIQF